MVHKRRRGTAIVDTPEGILVVSENNRTYSLPGGGARRGETRESAAIRELKEETNLIVTYCSFKFPYESGYHLHKVFSMNCTGTAKPRHEIKFLSYYNNSNVNISETTKKIIEIYNGLKATNSVICEHCRRANDSVQIAKGVCWYCGAPLPKPTIQK